MSFTEALGALLLAAMAAGLLREAGGRQALYVTAGAGLFAFAYILSQLGEVTEKLFGFAATFGIDGPMSTAFRAVGIGYTTEAGSGICRDIGEEGIARRVDAVGRVSTLLLAMPTLLRLLTLAAEGVK